MMGVGISTGRRGSELVSPDTMQEILDGLYHFSRHSPLATSSRFTGHRPQATIPTPHAPRTSICRYQRGQVVRRLSPTGYCLTPTADFPMNSVVLICTCIHYRLPPPVHGPSGSRAPARRLAKTERGP